MSHSRKVLTERDKEFIAPFGTIKAEKLSHVVRGHIQNLSQYAAANQLDLQGVIDPLGEILVLIEESARAARAVLGQKKGVPKPVASQSESSIGLSVTEVQQLKNLLSQLSTTDERDEDEYDWRRRA